MMKEKENLRERTKHFALRIIWLFGTLPQRTEAQVLGKHYFDQEPRWARTIGRLIAEAGIHRKVRRFSARVGGDLLARTARGEWNRFSRQAPAIAKRVRRTDSNLHNDHQARPRLINLPPSSFHLLTFYRSDPRWHYGVPPKGNANFAWIQQMLHHLAPQGSMALLLANGSMSSGSGGEGQIRQALIEADLVECMVALPGQLFTDTRISAEVENAA